MSHSITFSAVDAKNRFGELLDAARREPVIIKKHGRSVAVMLSTEEYKRLEILDDAWWGERAIKAMKNAKFLGHEKSMDYINSVLHAQDKSRRAR